ncbi:MAG: hypothetical protein FWE66_01350 [Oscillospiraceae bacterium]|nr:hypothetical protein [Oscillospiraceae bacterium]
MKTYLWIIVGMMVLLLIFVLLRLFFFKPKLKLLGKILCLFSIAVILLMLYYVLTRPLGVFQFTDSEWSAGIPDIKKESNALIAAVFLH